MLDSRHLCVRSIRHGTVTSSCTRQPHSDTRPLEPPNFIIGLSYVDQLETIHGGIKNLGLGEHTIAIPGTQPTKLQHLRLKCHC
jgi:hypothetical protein